MRTESDMSRVLLSPHFLNINIVDCLKYKENIVIYINATVEGSESFAWAQNRSLNIERVILGESYFMVSRFPNPEIVIVGIFSKKIMRIKYCLCYAIVYAIR